MKNMLYPLILILIALSGLAGAVYATYKANHQLAPKPVHYPGSTTSNQWCYHA